MIEQPSYSIEQQDDDRYHCHLFGVDNGESPLPNIPILFEMFQIWNISGGSANKNRRVKIFQIESRFC